MITLYIDTHDENITLALYQDEERCIEKKIVNSKEHSKTCVPLLLELLEISKINLDDINDIVVVNGPGSFTGIRIGITIAKTISFCKNIPIRSITSLERFLTSKIMEDYISLAEKNGYYIGKINHQTNEITEYYYLNNSEYQEFIKSNSVIEPKEIDYNKLILLAHKESPKNPHQVNPIYIKKIEVEK